ncbi:MAG: Phytochrome-like protein cph1 [Candidatus Accumulibacter appositus]|uniref:histidine kinase n=1 Tax=Candidatus Accumulibacter appositus TaxID=1454003 RepID=A0A011QG33_9PROT|nr:ATP-binding protein [Accumulibacter sp.]EXI77789.1 MAG: Phytochrome-like protein cph1 [Candidatus Accumulibacter appositus]HRF05651.1 PAS domain S-box protein [Accumulibacter sp.]
MKPASPPADELARLVALRACKLLDTPPEAPFDDLAELAARVCAAPIALISLVDEERLWSKARFGVDVVEIDRSITFCAHAIGQRELFLVADAASDERFADNPLVTGAPFIRFYAGAPLLTSEGHALGTLCVIDREPRVLGPDQQRALRVLARQVMMQVELRVERIALLNQLQQNDVEGERRFPTGTAELLRRDADSRQQLVEAERSRRALLSVLEDQQQAEAALRKSEGRLREAQRLAHIGSWVLDLKSSRLDCSAEACRIFEIDPWLIDTAHAAFLSVIHPQDRAAVEAARSESIGLQQPYASAHRLRFPDGRIKHVEERGETLAAADGMSLHLLGTVQDVTERVEKAAELKRIHGMLEALVEGSSDAIFIKDEQGRYVVGNHALAELVGKTQDEMLGADDFTLFPLAVAERFRADDQRIMARGTVESYEEKVVASSGESLPFLTTKGPLVIQGEVRGVFGIARDVSLLKAVQADLARARDELEARVEERTRQLAELNRELESFAYAVAHDLKAPLRGMAGYCHMLAEDYDAQLDEGGRRYLGNIAHGVAQMAELIDGLLSYSRMERRSLQCAVVKLRPLVDAVLAELQGVIDRQGAIVEVECDDLVVRADADGLAVVLRNLVDNALKFSCAAQPPLIGIRGERSGNLVTLAIEDNGIGFDMRFHERIFEIFQRLQRSESYPGTGVGLALVRKAMQRMGGRVWARSTPGQGTVFYIELADGNPPAGEA